MALECVEIVAYLKFTMCNHTCCLHQNISVMYSVQILDLQNLPCFIICLSADVDKSNQQPTCQGWQIAFQKKEHENMSAKESESDDNYEIEKKWERWQVSAGESNILLFLHQSLEIKTCQNKKHNHLMKTLNPVTMCLFWVWSMENFNWHVTITRESTQSLASKEVTLKGHWQNFYPVRQMREKI